VTLRRSIRNKGNNVKFKKIEVLDKGYVELQETMGNDLAIVNAARVSFLSESKGLEQDTKLINYLLRNAHTSPFEMVEFKFRVHCPLFVARQWMRHRTWSYSEVSRRYTEDNLEFYIPDEFRKQAKDNKQGSDGLLSADKSSIISGLLVCHVDRSLELYYDAIEKGVSREMARLFLPQNMYTTFIAKVDAHNLMHFLRLRLDKHAQYEMQLYSLALLSFFKQILPVTSNEFLMQNCDLHKSSYVDNPPAVRSPTHTRSLK
jgi:thymidylate synthase (FAD)